MPLGCYRLSFSYTFRGVEKAGFERERTSTDDMPRLTISGERVGRSSERKLKQSGSKKTSKAAKSSGCFPAGTILMEYENCPAERRMGPGNLHWVSHAFLSRSGKAPLSLLQ